MRPKSLCAAALALLPAVVPAQELRYSTEPSVDLAGTLIEATTIVIDDGAGGITTQPLPFNAEAANLTAYHRIDSGEFLFVLDKAVAVGGSTFRAGEILRAVGGGVLSELDPVAEGVPRGVEVDAVTMLAGDVVVSFDTDVELGGSFFADEDLARYDGATFSMAMDGSGSGLPIAADVDAAHRADDGTWGLSLDASGEIGGVTYRDHDVLSLDPNSGAWSMAYDASQGVAGWGDGGLDAVWFAPVAEPGQLQWSQSGVSVPENAGQVTLTITRTDGTDGIVAVDFETVADTAMAGDDFGPTNGNIAIDNGVDFYEFDVTIVDDGIEEADEQFFVDLTGVTLGGATLGSPTRVTVTIVDDDDPDLVFANGFEPLL